MFDGAPRIPKVPRLHGVPRASHLVLGGFALFDFLAELILEVLEQLDYKVFKEMLERVRADVPIPCILNR